MTQFINSTQQPSSLTSWRYCSSDGKIRQHGGLIGSSFFPKANSLAQVQQNWCKEVWVIPRVLRTEKEGWVVLLPSRVVFHWDLRGFCLFLGMIMDHSVNGNFPVPSDCLHPSRSCLQVRQDFSSRIGTVAALKSWRMVCCWQGVHIELLQEAERPSGCKQALLFGFDLFFSPSNRCNYMRTWLEVKFHFGI